MLSDRLITCSDGRPRPRGVVGVLGTAGDSKGDAFGAAAAFTVDIGVGREVGLLAVALSAATLGFEVPLLLPFGFDATELLVGSTAFFESTFKVSAFGTSFGRTGTFSSFAVCGVSTSGIESSTTVPLFLLL